MHPHGTGDSFVKFPMSQNEIDSAVQRVTNAIPARDGKKWTVVDDDADDLMLMR